MSVSVLDEVIRMIGTLADQCLEEQWVDNHEVERVAEQVVATVQKGSDEDDHK